MINKMRESVIKNSREKIVLKPSTSIYSQPTHKDRPAHLENLSFPKWMKDTTGGA